MALRHWPKSSVLLWPCEKKAVGQHFYFELSSTILEPVVKGLFDLHSDTVVAALYSWKSWLWQCCHLKDACRDLAPGVRPFLIGKEGPFVEIACRSAWWSLPRSVVMEFAQHYGIDVRPSATLFELLWCFCSATLGTDDTNTLAIVHQRVVNDGHSEATEALLQIEEALEVVEYQDAKHITQ